MNLSNFHTHCHYCDGNGNPEDYIIKAMDLKFSSIGFSSHAPLPFLNGWTMKEEDVDSYCREIRILKEKYKDKIQVYLGLEIDYYPGVISPGMNKFSDLNLDYSIGSVHCVYDRNSGSYLDIDGSEDEYIKIINSIFKGNMKEFVKFYYSLIRNMAEEQKADIVGHLDLIKKNNKNNMYFTGNESWYRDEVMKTLKAILKNRRILEVNTGGRARGYMKDFYPSSWILRECRKLDIPVMLNSDAHTPENLDAYFDEARIFLKESGYTKLYTIYDGNWTAFEL